MGGNGENITIWYQIHAGDSPQTATNLIWAQSNNNLLSFLSSGINPQTNEIEKAARFLGPSIVNDWFLAVQGLGYSWSGVRLTLRLYSSTDLPASCGVTTSFLQSQYYLEFTTPSTFNNITDTI